MTKTLIFLLAMFILTCSGCVLKVGCKKANTGETYEEVELIEHDCLMK